MENTFAMKFWKGWHRLFIRVTTWLVLATALITVGCGGGSAASPQTPDPVAPAPTVASVTVIPSSASIQMGATEKFKAQVKDSDGNVLTGVRVAWASSNNAATVSSSGMATGQSSGDATITATVSGVVGQAALIVSAQPVRPPVPVLTAINVTPNANTSILVGGSQTYTGTALDQTGAPMSGVTFTWHSSTNAASISASGVAIGANAGTAQISASAQNIQSNSSLLTVNVVPPPAPVLTSITVTPRSPSIQTGSTQAFQAAAFDQYSHSFPTAFTWSSDTPSVATINGYGVASGVSAGVANIFAEAGNVRGAAVLTVTNAAPPVMFSGPWEFSTSEGLYFVEANLTQTGNAVSAQAQENNPSFIQAELLSQTYPYAINVTNGISFVSTAGNYTGGFLTLEFIDGNSNAITFQGSLSGSTLIGTYNGYGHSGSFQAYPVPVIGQGWQEDDGETGDWTFTASGFHCDQCFLQATFTAGPDSNYTWNDTVQIECLGSWQCGNPNNGSSWTTTVSANQMGNYIRFYPIQPEIDGYIAGPILFLSGNGSF